MPDIKQHNLIYVGMRLNNPSTVPLRDRKVAFSLNKLQAP